MFPLNVQNDKVYFKDIKSEHLPQILKWYNKTDEFKYATGIDTEITLEELTCKYAETAICSKEFFAGIYDLKNDAMVGIIKGCVKYEDSDAAWISSMVIDTCFQGQGYGTSAVNLLLNYLNTSHQTKTAYLAVVEENIQGKAFWDSVGFKKMRVMCNRFRLNNKNQNVIIMTRQL
jgi:RimJ/RimL family protein N-acetyltransferase